MRQKEKRNLYKLYDLTCSKVVGSISVQKQSLVIAIDQDHALPLTEVLNKMEGFLPDPVKLKDLDNNKILLAGVGTAAFKALAIELLIKMRLKCHPDPSNSK